MSLVFFRFPLLSLMICSVLGASLMSCASKEKQPEVKKEEARMPAATATPIRKIKTGPSAEAKYLAVDAGADFVSEVAFKKGSTQLTTKAQKQILNLLDDAKSKSKIEKVTVLSWSDKEYPTAKQEQLSIRERGLAERRAAAINDFIQKKAGKTDVGTLNMAERPGIIRSLFDTSDAQLKEAVEKAGGTSANSKKPVDPKASKSVVLIQLEKDVR